MSEVMAAPWITRSTRCRRIIPSMPSRSRTSPITKTTLSPNAAEGAGRSALESATTGRPTSTSLSRTFMPTKPLAPVNSTVKRQSSELRFCRAAGQHEIILRAVLGGGAGADEKPRRQNVEEQVHTDGQGGEDGNGR